MSFKSPVSKGSHASGDALQQNESRLAPLLVSYPARRYLGQGCLAPTLLSLMECPDTLTIEDGKPPGIFSDSPCAFDRGGWVERERGRHGAQQNGNSERDPTGRAVERRCYTIASPVGKDGRPNHDRTIKIDDPGAAVGWRWDWLPYAAVAMISALGLAAALRLLKRM